MGSRWNGNYKSFTKDCDKCERHQIVESEDRCYSGIAWKRLSKGGKLRKCRYAIPRLTPEQKKCASWKMDEKLDRLGRWHCCCGVIMTKRWQEEDRQYEWVCMRCLKEGEDQFITERSIIEAYKEYCKAYDLPCEV